MRGLVAALALMAGPAAAQQDWDCSDYASLPQQGLNFCEYQAWQAADADLNAAYQAVLAIVGGSADEETLRAAQRAWITYRDFACDLAGLPMRGGSAEPLLTYGCLASLTERRAEDLWSFAALF